ncbi:MAG: hypothetical protein IPK87_00045 [Planctomycetes bacterium]|nr:hypothetical protein [Planctomycetota bacterium]
MVANVVWYGKVERRSFTMVVPLPDECEVQCDAYEHALGWSAVGEIGDADTLATSGSTYRIHAPPGVDRATGALITGMEEAGSQWLWAGYEYVPPMVGFADPAGQDPGTYGAQSGGNKVGSYHCWNRVYDPQTGRWTTPDPAQTPVQNLLVYVWSSPLGLSDVSGLEPSKPSELEVEKHKQGIDEANSPGQAAMKEEEVMEAKARKDAANGLKFRLPFTPKLNRERCGTAASWEGTWSEPLPGEKTGAVVQKVRFTCYVYKCDGTRVKTPYDDGYEYWESFPVEKGWFKGSDKGIDKLGLNTGTTGGPGTYGTCYVEGWSTFRGGKQTPDGFAKNEVSEAAGLAATKVKPSWWKNGIYKRMTLSWHCCDCDFVGNFTRVQIYPASDNEDGADEKHSVSYKQKH